MEFFKKMLNNLLNGDKNKLKQKMLIGVIIGIIIIIAASSLLNGVNQPKKPTTSNAAEGSTAQQNYTYKESGDEELEDRLIKILGQIDGVGRVDVMVTFSAGKESIPAYDVKKNDSSTKEKDSTGGSREINQNDYESSMVFEDDGSGGKKPVLIKDLQPVVKGVVVVADGAAKPEVKERICRAVQVLMDIPIHKVQVVERRK